MEQKINSAAIIAVGNEVLCGDVINTNAAYLAKELDNLGIKCTYMCVIPDEWEDISREIKFCADKAQLIMTVGGLGPTNDDITKQAVAETLGKEIYFDETEYNVMHEYFVKRGLPETENNKRQCYIPQGAKTLPNKNGTAPGIYLEDNGKVYVMLPGPPYELIPMFENYVKEKLISDTQRVFAEKYYMLTGLGEAYAEQQIRDNIVCDNGYTLNTYVDDGCIRLKATAIAENADDAQDIIALKDREVKALFKDLIFSEKNESLVENVGRRLLEKHLSISTAESCTGGLLAGKLTSVSGISEVFIGGGVTYANEAKMKMLGVKKETLDAYGAVSEETAREMAEGIASYYKTDIGVGITGIAGPGGGSEDKPVGLVYIGIYFKGECEVIRNVYAGNRERVRARTVSDALNLVCRYLQNY